MSNIDNVLFWGEEKSEEAGARRERHRGEKKRSLLLFVNIMMQKISRFRGTGNTSIS